MMQRDDSCVFGNRITVHSPTFSSVLAKQEAVGQKRRSLPFQFGLVGAKLPQNHLKNNDLLAAKKLQLQHQRNFVNSGLKRNNKSVIE